MKYHSLRPAICSVHPDTSTVNDDSPDLAKAFLDNLNEALYPLESACPKFRSNETFRKSSVVFDKLRFTKANDFGTPGPFLDNDVVKMISTPLIRRS